MAKQTILISIYNFKGGVGKTTATYNMGYILSEIMGLKILMVDADPQTNLTGLIHAVDFIDFEKSQGFYKKAEEAAKKNPPALITMGEIFKDIVSEQQPKDLKIAENVVLSKVQNYKNLFLIPGHLSMGDMDRHMSLGVAGIGLYKNYPGYVSNLFRKIGEKNDIDIILFDLNPSFGDFNASLVIGSDYILIPFSADIFSLQAMQSLQTKITTWHQKIHDFDKNRDDLGIIQSIPKFLGVYPQKLRTRKKVNKDEIAVEEAYASWISRIYVEAEKLFNILKNAKMCADTAQFTKAEGIIDFVSVGFDVQASGRPICDNTFSHKHQKSESLQVSLTKGQRIKKENVLNSYQKVIGRIFVNLSIDHRDLLAKSSKNFIEKLGLYHELNVGFEANEYLQIPQTPPASPEQDQHWYTNDEIDVLMDHYFSKQNHIIYHRAVSSSYLGEFELALQKLRDDSYKNNINKGIIPVNLGNQHWVMLYILYNQNNKPDIYYFDPQGKDIPVQLINKIKKTYPFSDPQSLDERVQNDPYNCGPWILETGRSFCHDGSFPPLGFDINATRKEHLRIIATSLQQDVKNKQKRKQKTDENIETELEQGEVNKKLRKNPTIGQFFPQQPTHSKGSSSSQVMPPAPAKK